MLKYLKGFYQSSERFRGYVDRYVANYRSAVITVEEALEHALVQEVAKLYMEEEYWHAVASTYAPMGECT